MNRERRIAAVGWAATEEWAVWNVGEAANQAEQLAAARVSDPVAARAAAAGIRALDQHALTQAGTWSLGVWLPDPYSGRAAATVLMRAVAPDGPRRLTLDELHEWAGRPPRARGVRITDCAAGTGELAVGPAVLQMVEMVPRFSRRITTQLNWFVLPPGTSDTVLCQFETEHPDLVAALGVESNVVTDNLVITLEDA